jgi:DNA-binding transcriptional LysR family regulator
MNVVYEFDLMLAVLNFVAMGIGCGLLPDYSSRMHMPGAVYRPLKPPHFAKKLAIVKAKGSSGVTDSFYKFAIEKLSGEGGQIEANTKQKHPPKARNIRP